MFLSLSLAVGIVASITFFTDRLDSSFGHIPVSLSKWQACSAVPFHIARSSRVAHLKFRIPISFLQSLSLLLYTSKAQDMAQAGQGETMARVRSRRGTRGLVHCRLGEVSGRPAERGGGASTGGQQQQPNASSRGHCLE